MEENEFLINEDDSVAYNVKGPGGATLYYRNRQEALDDAKEKAELFPEERAPAVYEVRQNAPVRRIR